MLKDNSVFLIGVCQEPKDDELIWKETVNGKFSIISALRQIREVIISPVYIRELRGFVVWVRS